MIVIDLMIMNGFDRNKKIYTNMATKLKSNLLTGIILIIVSLLFTVNTARAQGLYSKNKSTGDNTESVGKPDINSTSGGLTSSGGSTMKDSGGSLFRDGSDDPCSDEFDGPPGSECSGDGAPGSSDPIGEGLFILSFLSGMYALVKKKYKK